MENEGMQAAAADNGAGDEYDRPKVHYVCGGKLIIDQNYIKEHIN